MLYRHNYIATYIVMPAVAPQEASSQRARLDLARNGVEVCDPLVRLHTYVHITYIYIYIYT